MYLMYIDESGNTGTDYKNAEQPYFTMCGVIVKDSNWIKLDDELSKLKKSLFNTADIEIHAGLMYNPRRNTPFWGQRTLNENLKSLEDIIDFMTKSELKLIYCNIEKPNIKNYLGQDIKVDPYYFGLIILSYYFDMFLNFQKDKGSIITDRIDSIDEKITYSILNILRLTNEYKINSIIERPLKTDSKMSNMIQLADVAAFCANKKISFRNAVNGDYSKLSSKQISIIGMWKKLNRIIDNSVANPQTRDIVTAKFKELVHNNIINGE